MKKNGRTFYISRIIIIIYEKKMEELFIFQGFICAVQISMTFFALTTHFDWITVIYKRF